MSELHVAQGDPVTAARSLLRLSEPELRAQIQRLMARVPALSSNGLGRSLNHADDAHQRARVVLASSGGEEQVRRCLSWLAQSGVKPTQVARQRLSSMDAKHVVERWHDPRRTWNSYVSNGALIVACLLTRVQVVPVEGSQNAWLGLAVKSSANASPWAA
jgi:hypothetical protein